MLFMLLLLLLSLHVCCRIDQPEGSLSSGIEQLRTCNRCHRIFPVLSDLFNHMCEDENDLLQRKSATLSQPSNKYPSDHLFHNNPTRVENSPLFDMKSSSSNQGSSSSRSFKLNRRSSFNDSSTSSLRSKNLFSPTIESQQQTNSTPIDRSKSAYDTPHIPLLKRPLFRPDTNPIIRISSSSSPSPRPLFNDKQQHSSTAYVYLRHPSSPMRVVS